MKRISIFLVILFAFSVSAVWAQKSTLAPAPGQATPTPAPVPHIKRSPDSFFGLMNYANIAKSRSSQTGTTLMLGPNMKVNCNAGATINRALARLDRSLPNTLTVSGTCNENVLIEGFNRLTLRGVPGTTINDASGGTGIVVDIENSTDILLQGVTINGGVYGVLCGNFSVCRFDGNTIQGASVAGFQAYQSRATFDTNTIKNNSGTGLVSLESSSVRSNGGLVIQDNGFSGATVDTGGSFAAFGTTIQNNGAHGVDAYNGANLLLVDTTITGNSWYGVYVGSHSAATLGGTVVTGNVLAGFVVGDVSFALFYASNITGNSNVDVACVPQFSATRGTLTDIGGGTTNCVEP